MSLYSHCNIIIYAGMDLCVHVSSCAPLREIQSGVVLRSRLDGVDRGVDRAYLHSRPEAGMSTQSVKGADAIEERPMNPRLSRRPPATSMVKLQPRSSLVVTLTSVCGGQHFAWQKIC